MAVRWRLWVPTIPRTNPATVDLKRDRIEHWVGLGAQLSDRVGKLLAKSPAAAAIAA